MDTIPLRLPGHNFSKNPGQRVSAFPTKRCTTRSNSLHGGSSCATREVSPAFQMLLILAALADFCQEPAPRRSEGLMQRRGSGLAFWHNTASSSASSHHQRSRVTWEPSTALLHGFSSTRPTF